MIIKLDVLFTKTKMGMFELLVCHWFQLKNSFPNTTQVGICGSCVLGKVQYAVPRCTVFPCQPVQCQWCLLGSN